jgi:hypothetical protein
VLLRVCGVHADSYAKDAGRHQVADTLTSQEHPIGPEDHEQALFGCMGSYLDDVGSQQRLSTREDEHAGLRGGQPIDEFTILFEGKFPVDTLTGVQVAVAASEVAAACDIPGDDFGMPLAGTV